MTGIDPEARCYTWADLLTTWQVGRAFGFAEGVQAHSAAVDWMVAEATGPHHWDGRAAFPALDETARAAVMALYRRYLLLTPGGLDVRTAPRAEPATHSSRGVARGDRRNGAPPRARD